MSPPKGIAPACDDALIRALTCVFIVHYIAVFSTVFHSLAGRSRDAKFSLLDRRPVLEDLSVAVA